MSHIIIEAETVDADEQAALNAQTKHNQAIAEHHVEILKRIQRLEKLGGSQDYTYSVLGVLNAFGGTVNLTFLGQVLPDHALLSAARKQLTEKGSIIEVQERNRKVLKLVKQAA